MILGIHHFKVNLSDQEKFCDILASLPERASSTKGCLLYALYMEADESESFVLIEQWESRKDLTRFVESEEYKRVLFAMDLCKEMPRVQFFKVHLEGGMETLEKILKPELLE